MKRTGWLPQTTVILAVAMVASTGLGCELPPLPVTERDEESPDFDVDPDFELAGTAEDGQQLYEQQCATCHGVEGGGDGPSAGNLEMADFTQATLDPQRAYTTIRDGGRAVGLSPAMPAFREAMDDQQIRDVTAYVLEMREDDGDDDDERDDEVTTR